MSQWGNSFIEVSEWHLFVVRVRWDHRWKKSNICSLMFRLLNFFVAGGRSCLKLLSSCRSCLRRFSELWDHHSYFTVFNFFYVQSLFFQIWWISQWATKWTQTGNLEPDGTTRIGFPTNQPERYNQLSSTVEVIPFWLYHMSPVHSRLIHVGG